MNFQEKPDSETPLTSESLEKIKNFTNWAISTEKEIANFPNQTNEEINQWTNDFLKKKETVVNQINRFTQKKTDKTALKTKLQNTDTYLTLKTSKIEYERIETRENELITGNLKIKLENQISEIENEEYQTQDMLDTLPRLAEQLEQKNKASIAILKTSKLVFQSGVYGFKKEEAHCQDILHVIAQDHKQVKERIKKLTNFLNELDLILMEMQNLKTKMEQIEREAALKWVKLAIIKWILPGSETGE